MIYKIKSEQVDFIKENATIITLGNDTYYHLASWYQIFNEEKGHIGIYGFENIPQELKDVIREHRREEPVGYLFNGRYFATLEDLYLSIPMMPEEDKKLIKPVYL